MTTRHDDLDAFIHEEREADPAFGAGLEDADLRRTLIEGLVRARSHASLNQRTVAQRMGTTQSAVSELEGMSGDPRLSTLQRYARAVGKRVHTVIVEPNTSHKTYILEQPVFISGRVEDIEWLVRHGRHYTGGEGGGPDVALAS